jgi:DNA polymerase III delta subunit
MLTTLTGDNSFALKQELNALTKDFKEKYGGLAVEYIDGEDTDFRTLEESFKSISLFSSTKMTILRDGGRNKDFVESIDSLLAGSNEDLDIVIVEPKLDKRSVFYKTLKAKTNFKEFKGLDKFGLSNWLVKTATLKGGKISPRDAQYLVYRVGMSQERLGNELTKLLIYDLTVTKDSIDLLTEQSPQSTIFNLLNAALSGNKKRTLDLYKEQRELKIETQNIIALLTWQLHILAVLKSANNKSIQQISQETKISSYSLENSMPIASQTSLSKVKQLIAKLLELDVTLKSKRIDPDEALQLYLLGINL